MPTDLERVVKKEAIAQAVGLLYALQWLKDLPARWWRILTLNHHPTLLVAKGEPGV